MSGPLFVDQLGASQSVYVLGKIAAALGLINPNYVLIGRGGTGVDWERLHADALAQIERLRAEALTAQTEAGTLERMLDAAKAERDEAQAEVRAMLEGRREEEERARMRMLESVLAAAIHPKGMQATVLLPRYSDMLAKGGSEADWKRALLEDLDSLVALGLRGEVVL